MMALRNPCFILLIFVQLSFRVSAVAPPTLRLNDGRNIPSIALGTWLGLTPQGTREPVTNDDVEKAVKWAIDAGYRHIDTAHIYQVEDQVGRGVAAKIKDGTVKREELFITSKLWNDRHARDQVVPALRDSLQLLGLDYLDLYLIHWPVPQFKNDTYYTADFTETWRGMEEAKELGLAKSIGLSNFSPAQIDRVLALRGTKPAVLQVEINLNLQQPSLLAYAKTHNIKVMGYTPFGSLFPRKALAGAPPPRIDEPELVKMAAKHNKSVAQVALRYLVELEVIPIPKSITKERIEQNINIFDFQLSQEDKAILRGFDVNYRTIPQIKWVDHPDYPFERRAVNSGAAAQKTV